MHTDISIIIPVYNTEKYLRECLESVINQTFKNIEIICIDDGSTDESLKILNEYQQKDSRIIVKSQKNQKISAARNNGYKIATGKYVYFLDSDDYLYRETALETIYNSLEANQADIAVWGIIALEDGEFIGHHTMPKIRAYFNAPKEFNMISLCSSTTYRMFRKDFLDAHNITFGEQIRFAEDTIYSLECHLYNPKYVVINDTLHVYRKYHASSTANKQNRMRRLLNSIKYFESKEVYQKQPLEVKLRIVELWLGTAEYFYRVSDKTLSEHKAFTEILKFYENIYGKRELKKVDIYNKAILLAKKRYITILQKIFSSVNQDNHKVISILGVKLKFKYSKKQRPIETIGKFIKSYFLFPWYTYKTYKKIDKVTSEIKESSKPEYYSVPNTNILSSYRQLVCTTGFGHSGSGAVLDYLSEFSNVTTLGYHDTNDGSGYTKQNSDELDIFRAAGSVMDMERIFNTSNYFLDDLTIKHFLTVAEYFYRQGGIFNDYFWELTKKFVDNITDLKVKTDNGFEGLYFYQFFSAITKYANLRSPLLRDILPQDRYIYYLKNLSISEYRKIAKEYITGVLHSIESNEFLVWDQMFTTSKLESEKNIDYFGDFKQICVYRDPRDVYVTGINLKASWMPHNPIDFVKWFYHRGCPAYLEAPKHPNIMIIRFEDFVLNYEEISRQINEFVGLNEKEHMHKLEYFNPDISINNIGIYKTYEKQNEIKYIEEKLSDYCFYGEKHKSNIVKVYTT